MLIVQHGESVFRAKYSSKKYLPKTVTKSNIQLSPAIDWA